MTALALDIAAGALAAVEVRTRRERTQLARSAVVPLPAGLISGGEIADGRALSDEIRRAWKAAGFRGRRVRLGVANRRVLVRMIDLPAIDDPATLRAAVEQSVTEHLPIAAEEAVIDSRSVGRYWSGTESRERRMVVAAQRSMIDELVRTVSAAGLQPVGIDLQAFALLRALVPVPMVIDEGSADTPATAVCHMGTDVSQVVVAVDRRCHFTRALDAGAMQMIGAVADATGLAAHDAEVAIGACGFAGSVPDGWDEDGAARVRAALRRAAGTATRELGRSLDYYRSQPDARQIAEVVVTGPGALIGGLPEYLAGALSVPVRLGDPRLQVDAAGDLDLATASRAAVALGLALDAPDSPEDR